MSIDIAELIPSAKREVGVPGADLFPAATDDEWQGYLSDALWQATLDGVITGFTSDGEVITPNSGTTDLTGAQQQMVILYAAMKAIRNKMLTTLSVFRAKAGPVEYETQQAATVLKAILDQLNRDRDILLARLSDLGTSEVGYIDMVGQRGLSIVDGLSFYESGQAGHDY